MDLKKYTKLKAELLDKKETALINSASSLQTRLLEIITDEYISKLDVEDGYVKNTKANKDRINALNKLFESFQNTDILNVLSGMVSDFKDIHQLNIGYYSTISAKKVEDVQSKVFDKLKVNLGIEGGKLKPDGFLESFVTDPTLRDKIKQITLRAITSETVTLKDYKESVKLLIKGNKNVDGGLVRHFKTFATDTYALFDRQSNQIFSQSLNLKYAIYAGGIIESTRPFCEIRNNKVFTTEEIAKFGTSKDKYGGYEDKKTGYFQGKSKTEVYDPFTQCGGYNCRHTLNYISKEVAFRLRPELKDTKK